ncbi:alpha/beta hydrolase [Kaistia dalseonensis]|nr:alpha/beta hydrolase [Kaistia dalseonensis]
MRWISRLVRRVVLLLVLCVVAIFVARVVESERGEPLDLWQTYAPEELSAAEIDRTDWPGYIAAENKLFDAVRAEVSDKLDPKDRVPANRYFADSPINPHGFKQDWNRSFIIEPSGPPVGAAVLLHGLTDSPYSLRHLAESYAAHGFVAIGLRIPGHGTVPGALTIVDDSQWEAATRLAVREARRRIGDKAPLHLVGYSNGGALALMYALEAAADPKLSRPDRLVLLSPMIGVNRFARFAGLAGLPAFFPAFARSAWLDIIPEFNPFKYNSFPVNAARQSYQVTDELRTRIARLRDNGGLDTLPPILTFQSVLDATVSARAMISTLYDNLPANGSELVLFDINRSAKTQFLLRPASDTALESLLPLATRKFRTTVIANASADSDAVVARVVEPGTTAEVVQPLGIDYPRDVFSLSHIALPFPPADGLYGADPDPADNFGVSLGALAMRGERGALIVSLDWLQRNSSNPFYGYLQGRVDQAIDADAGRVAPDGTAGAPIR